jgi:hypothetical protein
MALRVQWVGGTEGIINNSTIVLNPTKNSSNNIQCLLQHWKLCILLGVLVFLTIVIINSDYLFALQNYLVGLYNGDGLRSLCGWNWIFYTVQTKRISRRVKLCTEEFRFWTTDQGPADRNRYSNSLRSGRSGDRSRWRQDFPHPFRGAAGPIQPPVKRTPGLFPEGKAAGAWPWRLTSIYRRG